MSERIVVRRRWAPRLDGYPSGMVGLNPTVPQQSLPWIVCLPGGRLPIDFRTWRDAMDLAVFLAKGDADTRPDGPRPFFIGELPLKGWQV